MAHCPYCGTNVKQSELFCVHCGKKLPEDIYERIHTKKQFNRFWFLPISISILFLIFSGIYYFILQSIDVQAKTLYRQGEEKALEENFSEAEKLFKEAIEHKENFPQAIISRDFAQIAIHNKTLLNQAEEELQNENYQKALSIIKNAEKGLNNYNGDVVTKLINKISKKRTHIKITQLKD